MIISFKVPVSSLFLATLLTLLVTGCGRYAAPFAPEKVAPQAVGGLTVQTTDSSVVLQWTSPEIDRRNKSLKQLDGFSVYRKTISSKKDITNDDVPFDLLAEEGDKAIADREQRREQAKALGAISRRVKVDPLLAAHQFEDKTPQLGTSYLYKIIPLNQGGVEGEVKQFVSITFRGATSDINLVSAKQLGVEDFVSQEEAAIQ